MTCTYQQTWTIAMDQAFIAFNTSCMLGIMWYVYGNGMNPLAGFFLFVISTLTAWSAWQWNQVKKAC